MANTSVKFIASTQRGAPTLNGTAGTLIAVLDALFSSGWGVTTALAVSVSGGIATATLTPGETFERDAVVLVAGATPSALNGEQKVKTASNTSITWETTAPDGVATGTITIKYAPQTSWSKVHAATNMGAYKSTHVQSNGHFIRIDDTGTTSARVRGFETMTDINSGTGPFPTDAQMNGGGYLWKSTFQPASAVKYRIFCDERFIVFAIATGSNLGAQYKAAPTRGFGDPIPESPSGDAWSTILACAGSDSSNSAYGTLDGGSTGNTLYGSVYSPRAFSGLGSAVVQEPMSQSGNAGGISGADQYFGAAPSAISGKVKTCRRLIRSGASGQPVRSEIPGVIYIPQSGMTAIATDGDVFTGAGDLSGRHLLAVAAAGSGNTDPTGIFLVDVTGPWR